MVGVFFIIGGLLLAAFGYVNPIVAAIMHNLGSIIVIFNSARLVRQGEELDPYRPVTDQAPVTGASEMPGALTPRIA
jgi:hypothetical protein